MSAAFRLHGRVDFSSLAPPSTPPSAENTSGLRALRAPGLDVVWNDRFFEIASRDGVVAIAPRAGIDNDRALHWIDRYCGGDPNVAAGVDGPFAVVVVDTKERRAQLVVDRFAIDTLCYRFADGTLTFADAADAVDGSELDLQSIYDYLYFHIIPAPRTVFVGVRRVEASQRIDVSENSLRANRYWQPQFREDDSSDLAGRFAQFRDLVQKAVETNATNNTACFLSGGTDSSTVAGMLSALRGAPVHAYSIGFDAQGYDEMAYARIAARHFGLVHHEYYVTPDDLIDAIPKIAAALDQPFGNSSLLPAYCCALRAKDDGVDRMLAGDGGDELFAGNTRYALQHVFELYHRLPRRFRAMVEPAAANWRLFRRVPGLRQVGGYVRHARVPMPERFDTFRLLNRLDAETMFAPAFRCAIDPNDPLRSQRATWNATPETSLLNRMLAYDWKYTLADNDLPKVRYATELARVEVRHPFLSRDVVDFSLSVPPEWKLRRLKLRWFFKEALRDFLPVEILRKKKHGFGLPFGHWVLRDRRLRMLVDESLNGIATRGIIRSQFASELSQRLLPEAPGYYGEMTWLLMMLEQWLRAHAPTAAPPRTDFAAPHSAEIPSQRAR